MLARQLLCDLLWVLSREHAWGRAVSTERVLRFGLEPAQRDRGRDLLAVLRREPYVEYYPGRGYRLKNDPDSQALAATRLTTTCGLSRLSVDATLSRFAQAGGFDTYDVAELATRLVEW